jgi:pimeloyl-ACP methyl ester carboxylesterase
VLAHPAVTGQSYGPLVDLAEEMTDFFDVYTFDFRGHGASGGVLDLEGGLEGPAADLEAVLGLVREGGHLWVGVAGFSLGGMAAFALAVEKPHLLDALAVVGMPPRFPDTGPYRMWLPLWFLLLRGLGARFAGREPRGPTPLDLAQAFPPGLPLLVVHGEREAFYPQEDLFALVERLEEKAELLFVPDAGHAELASGKKRFISWLLEKPLESLRRG